MRSFAHLLALCMFWAASSCSPGEDAQPGPGNAASIVPATVPVRYEPLEDKFRALEAEFPRRAFYADDYYSAKLAAALEAEELQFTAAHDLAKDSGYFDVITCQQGWVSQSANAAENYDILAKTTIELQKSLQVAGYKPEVFETPLMRFEQAATALISQWPAAGLKEPAAAQPADDTLLTEPGIVLLSRLAEDLERERKALQADKPRFVAQGECGAGEHYVLIESRPTNARVWLLPSFEFYKCALRTPNPYDVSKCRWVDVSPPEEVEVSGTRFYQAKWPDGKYVRGVKDFGYVGEADEQGNVPKVVIRP